LRDYDLVGPGGKVLVACSGGPDSTALLHALSVLRRRLRFDVVAHGVDHGLRPEAGAELAVAAEVAATLKVPFEVSRTVVAAGSNLQARARQQRLVALSDAARACGAGAIATGHTADDRAETVLLRLLRGAGPRGLSVLPPSGPVPGVDREGSFRLIRPLIAARRADVLAHLGRHRLPFASDPSNRNSRFLRVRVREELLPLLDELSPRIVEHLCALADMLGREGLPRGAEPGHASPDWLEGLGRAQRLAIQRARTLNRPSVRLRLRGGREVEVTFPAGRIVLTEVGVGRETPQ
jgi:tRNA(Ile)-lysidine synthase